MNLGTSNNLKGDVAAVFIGFDGRNAATLDQASCLGFLGRRRNSHSNNSIPEEYIRISMLQIQLGMLISTASLRTPQKRYMPGGGATTYLLYHT
jgi:hypothetical protein